jgi:hypothetical protein
MNRQRPVFMRLILRPRTGSLLWVLGLCGLVALIGCSAGADIRSPGPDFGYIPNAIGIVPPGRVYLESAALLDHEGSDRGFRLPVLVRAGVAKDWELRVQAWAVQSEERADGRETGTGPVQVGFKHRLSEGGGTALEPAYGFEMEFLLPVSTNDFDDGKVEPSVFVNVDHTLSENGIFTWNVGALTPVDVDGDQFVQGFLAGAYSHFVSPDIQLYATGSLNYPASREDGGTAAVLGAGGYWYASQWVVLYADYQFGVTDDASDGLITIGVSFAF